MGDKNEELLEWAQKIAMVNDIEKELLEPDALKKEVANLLLAGTTKCIIIIHDLSMINSAVCGWLKENNTATKEIFMIRIGGDLVVCTNMPVTFEEECRVYLGESREVLSHFITKR